MSSNVHNFQELRPRIIVMGVGGAGGNAVNNMIASGLHGVEFVAANTDAQALSTSGADVRLQLGANLTEGLGAGSNPEIGEGAAEEVMEEMKSLLSEVHMVFIACGMGGGTGTGAAPVIARIAQELGVLTVAVVTKPFQFEGQRRMRIAEAGIEQLRQYVDTMIVIPNQNLFRLANEQTTFADSFCLADSVLNSGVACVTDLIMKEGLINLDFADVKTVITEMGAAVMGTGVAHGEGRARKAAEEAISNPLIDDISLAGAKGLLISISGGQDMTLFEVDEVASRIRQEVDPNANIIVGATFDDQLEGYLRVSLVASGLNHGHPESMHQEADRRRMELDAEIEQNTLGLNERLQSLETNKDQLGAVHSEQGGGHGDPLLNASSGRLRPQAPLGATGPKNDRSMPMGHEQGLGGQADRGVSDSGQNNAGPNSGRGTVKIVNKPPRFMSPEGEAGYTPPAKPGINNAVTGREFVAGAPQSVNRSMRRMPSMEDLPITGQNQLRAYKAPEGKFKEAEPKKKAGFFSRFTGRNRKQEPNQQELEQQDANQQEKIQQDPAQQDPVLHEPSSAPFNQAPHQPLGDVNQDHLRQNQMPYEGPREPVREPRYQDAGYKGHPAPDPSGVDKSAHDQSRSGAISRPGQVYGQRPGQPEPKGYDKPTAQPALRTEAGVGEVRSSEAPLKDDYDLRMEEHYKMHPSSRPDQATQSGTAPELGANGPAVTDPLQNQHLDQGPDQVQSQENWAPSRPETPAERYPTLDLNQSAIGPLPLDEDETIADIPPFLKEKRKG